MAKKDQEASWEKKRHQPNDKNDFAPVPEIQSKGKKLKSKNNNVPR